jgi:hypothetical protein
MFTFARRSEKTTLTTGMNRTKDCRKKVAPDELIDHANLEDE